MTKKQTIRRQLIQLLGMAGVGALALSGCTGIDVPDTQEEPAPSSGSPSVEQSSGPGDGTGAQEPEAEQSPAQTDDRKELHNDREMEEEEARSALEELSVEPPQSMDGYSRDSFPHWLSAGDWGWEDIPYDTGCDTREVALYRDAVDVDMGEEECEVLDGTWTTPYTGETVRDSSELDIDHIVPLGAAFRAGAGDWDEEKRRAYANSPLVVVVSSAAANREKGDKGPEVWRPEDESSWCVYSIRWIAIKDEFGLDLTSDEEREALTEMLDTCGGA